MRTEQELLAVLDGFRHKQERVRPAGPIGAQRLLAKMAKMQRRRSKRIKDWGGK